jgi:hypothetical protein
MSCPICNHPDRQAIDEALVAGSATLAALSQQYRLSTSALHRHKAHLQAKVGRAKAQLQDNLLQGCLFWLTQALEMIMQTASAAQAEGSHKLVLQALAQGTRLITIILKHDLPLDDRTVFELLSSPQWADQSGLLPHDPNIMAKSRQSLTGIFSSPCPEGEALPEDLDTLQAILSTLTQPPDTPPKTANRKPETQNRPFKQWEKSGKSAGKIPPKVNKTEQDQGDKLLQKIAGIDLASLLHAPVGAADSPLASLFQAPGDDQKIPTDIPLAEFIYEKSLRAESTGKNPVRPAAPGPGRGAAPAVPTAP